MQLSDFDQQKISNAIFFAREHVSERYADVARNKLTSTQLKKALAQHLNMALAISDIPLSIDERVSLARDELWHDESIMIHTRAAAIRLGEKLARSGIYIAMREVSRSERQT